MDELIGWILAGPKAAELLLLITMDRFASNFSVVRQKLQGENIQFIEADACDSCNLLTVYLTESGKDVLFSNVTWADMAPRLGLEVHKNTGHLPSFNIERARLSNDVFSRNYQGH